MITHRCACKSFLISIIMTSITWAGPRCVQELGDYFRPSKLHSGKLWRGNEMR